MRSVSGSDPLASGMELSPVEYFCQNFKIIELDTIFVCKQGQSLASIVDSVFEQSLVSDSLANTAYIY